MKLYTAEQMKEVDDHAISIVGVTAHALMETAGRAVAARAVEMIGSGSGRVLVLCGKGNNGGDGLVAARILNGWGFAVRVLFAGPDADTPGPAGDNLKAAKAIGIPVEFAPKSAPEDWNHPVPDLCIDALLGVGSRGAPRGAVEAMISACHGAEYPVLSVDIPSGVDASTGEVPGFAMSADVTVTFGLPKVGLFCDPGATHAGRVEVVDIGFPNPSVQAAASLIEAVGAPLAAGLLPARPKDSNKGTFGSVVVIAGSSKMPGAAALTARAVLRAGAGLVRLVLPETAASLAGAFTPEVICHPLKATDSGSLSPEALEPLLELLKGAKAVAIGPGLTTDPGTASLIRALLPRIQCPMVLDADALNTLSETPDIFLSLCAPTVITPHPGEMSRLLKTDTASVQSRRLRSASEFAKKWGVVTLLKGNGTIVAAPDSRIRINTGGNAGMASAGMGDTLTGIIAALIAQGMEPFDAASAGAFVHTCAGDLAAWTRGSAGLLASDVADSVPRAQFLLRSGRWDCPETVSEDRGCSLRFRP